MDYLRRLLLAAAILGTHHVLQESLGGGGGRPETARLRTEPWAAWRFREAAMERAREGRTEELWDMLEELKCRSVLYSKTFLSSKFSFCLLSPFFIKIQA